MADEKVDMVYDIVVRTEGKLDDSLKVQAKQGERIASLETVQGACQRRLNAERSFWGRVKSSVVTKVIIGAIVFIVAATGIGAIFGGCATPECVTRNAWAIKYNIEEGMKAESIEEAQPRLKAAYTGAKANIKWVGESEDKSVPSLDESYEVAQETTVAAEAWAAMYSFATGLFTGSFDWGALIEKLLMAVLGGGLAYPAMHTARKKLIKGKDNGNTKKRR